MMTGADEARQDDGGVIRKGRAEEVSGGEDSRTADPSQTGSGVGRVVFVITLVATLVFFWWLLIYDHAGPGAS